MISEYTRAFLWPSIHFPDQFLISDVQKSFDNVRTYARCTRTVETASLERHS